MNVNVDDDDDDAEEDVADADVWVEGAEAPRGDDVGPPQSRSSGRARFDSRQDIVWTKRCPHVAFA